MPANEKARQKTSFKALLKKPWFIGGIVAVVVIAVAVTAFALTRPAPVEPPAPEKPIVIDDTPKPPPEPAPIVFPLTGLPAPDKAATLNRTLSVKIENTPVARPQTGISSADVVYETVTEGGITRLNCLFQSRVPEEVGPVRSARLSDLSIVPEYDALFFFSGANPYVEGQIADAGLPNMSHGQTSSLYYRVDYREAPHNLYLSLAQSYGVATEKGLSTTLETPRGFEFSSNGADGTNPAWATAPSAANVTLGFSDAYVAEWAWDAEAGAYLRSMDGPSIDAATDEQLAATNVVVLRTSYVLSPDNLTLFIDLKGEGEATLFVGGKRLDGTWESDGTTPPRFKDASGNPILLNPGTTWFEVLDPAWSMTIS
ncbi:MAG: DUF3048 domain-containing protein [Coriobacteriales bacterium]|jgi:hypothetical protein|nr:DUF3048 domain-containing protein [Coriobacteriales bacterium]